MSAETAGEVNSVAFRMTVDDEVTVRGVGVLADLNCLHLAKRVRHIAA